MLDVTFMLYIRNIRTKICYMSTSFNFLTPSKQINVQINSKYVCVYIDFKIKNKKLKEKKLHTVDTIVTSTHLHSNG